MCFASLEVEILLTHVSVSQITLIFFLQNWHNAVLIVYTLNLLMKQALNISYYIVPCNKGKLKLRKYLEVLLLLWLVDVKGSVSASVVILPITSGCMIL